MQTGSGQYLRDRSTGSIYNAHPNFTVFPCQKGKQALGCIATLGGGSLTRFVGARVRREQ
jgi:hypothetical protein